MQDRTEKNTEKTTWKAEENVSPEHIGNAGSADIKAAGADRRIPDRSQVAIVYCDSYDEDKVYKAMSEGIAALGGLESFVNRDEHILVKPNFLVAAKPDKAVTTHPAVIKGMLRILNEQGFIHVACGDSPGHGSLENALKAAGLSEAIKEYGCAEADMSTEVLVEYPEGITAKQFYYAKAVTEADAIIGLSKMKTHALEKLTGAVKNMYGLVCGYRKAAGHVKFPNASMFARMLADIHRSTPQRLHIMDGITAMEGNGPASGTPVQMNVLLFSKDPVALDTVFSRLVNVDPELIPTNVQGAELGIGTCDLSRIDIIDVSSAGAVISAEEAFAKYGKADFDADRTGNKKSLLSRFSDIMTSIARRPYIDAGLCVSCGICAEHCPVPGKALEFKNGRNKPPVYNYRKCIRCYCCQELCPQHAIRVRGSRYR